MLDAQILIDFDIVEILLISVISFVGAFTHEFIKFISKNKRVTIYVWFKVLTNTIIVAILSLAIDPFIATIHPRMILLPPLLMGLLGEELLNKLIHWNQSSEVIEYILSFFKIKRDKKVDKPTDKEDHSLSQHSNLFKKIIELNMYIEDAISIYEKNNQFQECILDCYKKVSSPIGMIRLKIVDDPDMEDIIIQEKVKMDELYSHLVRIRQNILFNNHESTH